MGSLDGRTIARVGKVYNSAFSNTLLVSIEYTINDIKFEKICEVKGNANIDTSYIVNYNPLNLDEIEILMNGFIRFKDSL